MSVYPCNSINVNTFFSYHNLIIDKLFSCVYFMLSLLILNLPQLTIKESFLLTINPIVPKSHSQLVNIQLRHLLIIYFFWLEPSHLGNYIISSHSFDIDFLN
ncbi:hypothetical protein HanIR_Chr04g0188681 [Helianthus annuus]|nr:hypothetical protein HanIR_Chr04g0188681 [Helianthus annuus]